MMNTQLPQILSILAGITLVGCNATSTTLQNDQITSIAQQFGEELQFVSNGHFIPASWLSDRSLFSSESRGFVALTETSLIWRDGRGTSAYQDIRLDSLQGVSYHRGFLQLKIDEQIYVLKPTLKNPFKNTSDHTAKLYELLKNHKVPELALETPFGPPQGRPHKRDRGYHSDYDNASESYHEQTFTDKGHVDDGNGNFVMGTVTRR
jgi:hypothetical protein